MQHLVTKVGNNLQFWRIWIILVLFSIFFPVRHVFLNEFAYKTGQYSDFTSFSIYLIDIILLIGFIFNLFWLKKEGIKTILAFKWLILWLFLGILANNSSNIYPHLYFLGKIAIALVAYGTISSIFKYHNLKTFTIKGFLVFSSIQSLLSVAQFLKQSFLGLNLLGEQQISPYLPGFAKIITENITYIRGYGTFPHPNPLSAFLVVGVLTSLYLLFKAQSYKHRMLYAALLFINILGLTSTFSRAGYLGLFLGLIVFFAGLAYGKLFNIQAFKVLFITLLCLIAAVLLFKPFLLTRANINDTAAAERGLYTNIGIKIVADRPIFGTGLGESVLHMKQYSPVPLEPWQIQPVHNYFLLVATESGILGALILLWILLKHLISTFKNFLVNQNPYHLFLASVVSAFLVLMQFDHYFYTLTQTLILLWIILGIISAKTKTPVN